ncbi:hypothetical protein EI546_05195 [Aequorivita sp. H23M31]|uniref:Uncharacterized protein n=1 Tax=Aequorivita ciconiae TaxID=2494375 RepID=A0A410G1N6_9FLAO|nr:hypothetical protein [Aequorivita sp. H23M31]QAA81161.1 hypothetical protein EI546_05195 [Aequorivita sp. H23M31]
MKKLVLIFALAAFTVSFAQENVDKKKETVVTKTAVKDNKGVEVSSKAVSKSEQQQLKLNANNPNQVNQEVVMNPVKVDTDVTYGYEGNRFKFMSQKDEEGYRLMTVKDNATNNEYAIIKPTSQNGYYIYSQNGKSSFGYFNEEGNFVVESYDPKTDAIVSQVYKLEMDGQKQLKGNK